MNKVKKGEIYLYDFGNNSGSIQCNKRPVVVVQADELNITSTTTIIAAITSAAKNKRIPSHVYIGKKYGLDEPSMILMEQVRTVNQSDLESYIGTIPEEEMKKFFCNIIRKTYGLWNYSKHDDKSMKYICGICLEKIRRDKSAIFKRKDCFDNEKRLCDQCGIDFGYQYILRAKEGVDD